MTQWTGDPIPHPSSQINQIKYRQPPRCGSADCGGQALPAPLATTCTHLPWMEVSPLPSIDLKGHRSADSAMSPGGRVGLAVPSDLAQN